MSAPEPDRRPGDEQIPEIGWLRAIAVGIVVFAVGIGAGVIGSSRILTNALGVTRGGRETLATSLFLVTVFVLAFALRRLQRRGVI